MFFVQFARCVIDPLILNLFVRVFAHEEAEGGFWRAFLCNAVLLGCGIGLSTVIEQLDPGFGMWIQMGTLSFLGWALIAKLFKIGAFRALPILICYAVFLCGASFGISYLWKGTTQIDEVVHTQYPSTTELTQSLDINYLMKGNAEEE